MGEAQTNQAVEISRTNAGQVDHLEAAMAKLPQLEFPLVHRFTPGLYAREILMPKGSLIVSKTHKTEHPFVVLSGRASVWTEADGIVQITGPHVGITKPGTRRVLFIHEDCRWITFHPTPETDLERIEEAIIDRAPTLEINPGVVRQLKGDY